jgi:5'-3' exonuclease
LPNLDPWINQNNTNNNEEQMWLQRQLNKFENYLLSIRAERQKMIHPKSHPTYNERHQKIIEMLDWTLEKYKAAVTNIKEMNQQNEQVIINNIIEELDKKRDIAINKKKKTLLKDEVLEYGEEEDTIDYILFRVRELTGNKLY